METQSKPLEKRFGWREVDWKTAFKMGLGKQFLPFGVGVYFLAKDLNKGKPTFSGSSIYHGMLSFAPYAVPIIYFLDKQMNQ